MSKKYHEVRDGVATVRDWAPEDLVELPNQRVTEMDEYCTKYDGQHAAKRKSSNKFLGAAGAAAMAGARLSNRPARLSDEEPMTAAEMELLAGDSKLPDDFRLDELRSSTMKHMHNQDPSRMVKTILATPSDFDRLIASANSLIVEMRRQNELVSTLLLMLADARIEPADDFDANPGDSK